jgi:hypothetical protein
MVILPRPEHETDFSIVMNSQTRIAGDRFQNLIIKTLLNGRSTITQNQLALDNFFFVF